MVLLIGNYPIDRQHSMQRFGELMLAGLRSAGLEARIIWPRPIFGRILGPIGFGKWLGYIDKYLWFPFQLRRQFSSRPAVVHICDHSNAVYINRRAPAPVVVTCHDLLAVRGGLGQETDCPASATGRFLQHWILRSLRRADALACVSKATAQDAERLVRAEYSRPAIEVVPLALNYDYRPIPAREAWSIVARVLQWQTNQPFVLHVGSNLRRKNREGVIRIVALTKERWNGRLVFAGEPLTPKLLELAQKLGLRSRIDEVRNPGGEVLRALYNCATALLFPSRFEGFGWPIIEAQACGCPVLCSNTGPMPEAAGEAGLLRDVTDEKGFAADLLGLTDPAERATWSERSLVNASRYSTGKMIGQYIDLYRRMGAKI